MQPTPPSHAIRLGDAWEPPQPDGDRVRLTRRFGRPSGLEPGDRVLLVVASAATAADVSLNGMPLPPIMAGGRWEQDVSGLLRDRNELCVLVPARLFAAEIVAGTARQLRGRPPAAMGMVAIEVVAKP